MIAALTPEWTAFAPREPPIVCLERRVMGTGNAPEFNLPTNCFASTGVKLPDIWAVPPVISSRTTGAEIGEPSRYIATDFPTLAFVIWANNAVPVSSNCKPTFGSLVFWSNSNVAFFKYLPVNSVEINCGPAFKFTFPSGPTVACWGVPAGASTLNSRSGVCPIIAVAFSTSVIPGKSTINFSPPPEPMPPSWTCTTGSETPNRFTLRSITSRRADIESETCPAGTPETSAL